jgi:hypothetical protein
MRVRRHLAAAVLAPLLLLAACGEDDPEPQIPEPSATPMPTATESSTAAQESPEEFIRRWAAAETKMQNTGAVADYLALSTGCKPCKEIADLIAGFYEAGGWVKWAGWDIKGVERQGGADARPTFSVSVVSAPTKYRETKGGPIKSLEGGPTRHLVTLSRRGASWVAIDTSEAAS